MIEIKKSKELWKKQNTIIKGVLVSLFLFLMWFFYGIIYLISRGKDFSYIISHYLWKIKEPFIIITFLSLILIGGVMGFIIGVTIKEIKKDRNNFKLWLYSLIIAFVLNFKFRTSYILIFLLVTLIFGCTIFLFFTFISRSLSHLKKRNTKQAIEYILLTTFILIVIISGIILSTRIIAGGNMFPTPAHFRTNIITGKCDYGGYSIYSVSDPWYYKKDCDLSEEEKNEIKKKAPNYEEIVENCFKEDRAKYGHYSLFVSYKCNRLVN